MEAEKDTQIDPRELSSFLASRLHPLMVPDEIIVLPHIPLNADGKIDRGALESMTLQQAS